MLPMPAPIQQANSCDLELGIRLCKILFEKLSDKGIYPALTGGLLYKSGNRKDIDIVLYRNRQSVEEFETIELKEILSVAGVEITGFFGFVTKAKWEGVVVDLFNPETKIIQDCDEYAD